MRLEDYEITQRTLSDRVIATEPRTFRSGVPGSARYFFQLPETQGDPILLYGEYVSQQVTDASSFAQFQTSRVSPSGDRRSASWASWEAMDEIARAFRGSQIRYDMD